MKNLSLQFSILVVLMFLYADLHSEEITLISPATGAVICSDDALVVQFEEIMTQAVDISLIDFQFHERKLLAKSFTGSTFIWEINDPAWYDKEIGLVIENSQTQELLTQIAPLKIAISPKITSQTESAIVCKGELIVLQVDADGSGLKYQWYRDGELIPDANKTALIFENAEHDLIGIYHCVVSSDYSCQSVMSSPISVFVSTKTQFTVAPLNIQWTYKATIGFKVGIHSLDLEEARNTKFRWYRDTLNIYTLSPEIIALEDGGRISGAWSDHLIIKDMIHSDRGRYFCIAEGRCGKDTIYTFIGDDLFMKITNLGYDYNDCEGGVAFLEVEVEKLVDAEIEYQWYNTGLRLIEESEKFVGTKTSKLQINDVQKADAKAYYCRVTMPKYDIFQNSEIFTINPAYLPEIIREPKDYIVRDRENLYIGQLAILTGISSNRICKFEWFRNDTLVNTGYSMGSSTYLIGPPWNPRMAVPTDVGRYHCVITHQCTTLTTKSVNVVWGYDDVILCNFEKGVLEVDKAKDGEEKYTYIWHKEKKPFVPNFRIKGNGTHKLEFSWVIVDDSGSYEVWRQHKESGELEYLGKIYLEVKGPPEVRKQFPALIVNEGNYLPKKNCAVYSHGPMLFAQLYYEDAPLGEVEVREITNINHKFHAYYLGGYNTNLQSGIYKYKFWNECGESWSEQFEIINSNYKPSGEVKPGGDDDYVSSVSDFAIPQMFIYPNPARDYLTVHFADLKASVITIRDLLGVEIDKIAIENHSNSVIIDLSGYNLPKGAYFIQATDGSRILYDRFIVE
ncbi:MAG: T9SS type A sorting domain-containing protein [Candidatus Kapabacteria bacterium]|nr:T9SS type A sorting domain-containing protein [Candidatus Kapabacteria bacterium]